MTSLCHNGPYYSPSTSSTLRKPTFPEHASARDPVKPQKIFHKKTEHPTESYSTGGNRGAFVSNSGQKLPPTPLPSPQIRNLGRCGIGTM